VNARMPVIQTFCGPPVQVQENSSLLLPFPVISVNSTWGHIYQDYPWGATKSLSIPQRLLHNLGDIDQARASWFVPPAELGNASAALAYIVRNSTSIVGMGCVVDARWARGQILLNRPTNYWEQHIGLQSVPIGIEMPDTFLQNVEEYSPTISVDQYWINVFDPVATIGSTSDYSMTKFEALLNSTSLSSISNALKYPAFNFCTIIQYFMAVYFVDALSRIGWNLQLLDNGTTGTYEIDPALRNLTHSLTVPSILVYNGEELPSWSYKQQSFYVNEWTGGNHVWQQPLNTSTNIFTLQHLVYRYATGWKAEGYGAYISIVILMMHFAIAVGHTLFILLTGQTSEAWSSIPEMLTLAYNSEPRNGRVKNCGAGIQRIDTFRRKVKVGVFADGQDDERLEMVISDEKAFLKDRTVLDKPVVNKLYG
jgi:hypothetical protein